VNSKKRNMRGCSNGMIKEGCSNGMIKERCSNGMIKRDV
jgi:hypothetical protein